MPCSHSQSFETAKTPSLKIVSLWMGVYNYNIITGNKYHTTEDEYSPQLQLALLIASKFHNWTRQKQSSEGRHSCRHHATYIVWDEQCPAAGQIRSGQLDILPSARMYLDKSRVSKPKIYSVWLEIKASLNPTPLEQYISVFNQSHQVSNFIS